MSKNLKVPGCDSITSEKIIFNENKAKKIELVEVKYPNGESKWKEINFNQKNSFKNKLLQ